MTSLYDTDFSSWADKTAQLLAEKRFGEIDLPALIEEVQDLARRHRDAYESHVQTIIAHFLKLTYAPDAIYDDNKRIWQQSIRVARINIRKLLRRNAGAARDRDAARLNAFEDAREVVQGECDDFGEVDWPDVCPWTIEQVLDPDFFPSRANR
jgi:Domain of unknown function DUF29